MQLKALSTERRNRDTENLDTMSTRDLVAAMNREDAVVPRAIKRVLPEIAELWIRLLAASPRAVG